MPTPTTSYEDLLEARRASGVAMFNDNRMKLGIFGSKRQPRAHGDPCRDHVRIDVGTRQEDRAAGRRLGFEAMLPVARYRGMGGETNFNGSNYETHAWAAGIAEATENIMVSPRSRSDQAPDRRREGVGHGRPHLRWSARTQHDDGLVQGRDGDVRRHPTRARHPVPLRLRVDRGRQAHVDRGRGRELHRRVLRDQGRVLSPKPIQQPYPYWSMQETLRPGSNSAPANAIQLHRPSPPRRGEGHRGPRARHSPETRAAISESSATATSSAGHREGDQAAPRPHPRPG